jgi:hypothetical protein
VLVHVLAENGFERVARQCENEFPAVLGGKRLSGGVQSFDKGLTQPLEFPSGLGELALEFLPRGEYSF